MTVSTIYHPRMISVPVSPYCELARWILDRRGIPYYEECHAPVFHVLATRRCGGGNVVPVLDTGEASLLDAREVVDYYEARGPREQAVYPEDTEARTDTKKLFDFFFDIFGVAVRSWAYAYMLPMQRSTSRAWSDRIPLWERIGVLFLYPLLAAAVRRNLGLQPDTISRQQQVIEAALAQVEARLADGRRFLMGEKLTAPDLALAALAAPIMFPPEYGGPMPTLDQLPPAMRVAVDHWRARPAGQFILRLYREERPPRPVDLVAIGKHASGQTLKDRLANFVIRPAILRPIFGLLRWLSPILVFGKRAIITRYDDVVEILKRDTDFTISQVNAEKINQIDGPFILGMDDSPQYEQEKAMLHQVVRPDDLERIRKFVRESAATLVDAARPRRQIDVVSGLARVVPVRLVASYFGMPGPDDPTMMRWMRDVFHYLFADLTNDPRVLRDALSSSTELRRHMDGQIALRKSLLSERYQGEEVLDRLLAMQDTTLSWLGENVVRRQTDAPIPLTQRLVRGQDLNDDVLSRLLSMQDAAHPWLDDNAVRRNLAGVIVGAVDTTSKFVTLAIDELLRRPQSLAEAREAALKGDVDAVRRYAYEAVRFNPHHPLQVRFCTRDTQVAADQRRSKNIPAGTFTYVATLSAMFDPEVFTSPEQFNAQREVEYLHFGYGLHTCFGRAINGVQIPELLAALLRLPDLRRAPGSAGHILYDGPFPNRLILEFDA